MRTMLGMPIAISLPLQSFAAPIVTVRAEDVRLNTRLEIPLAPGGMLVKSDSYAGPIGIHNLNTVQRLTPADEMGTEETLYANSSIYADDGFVGLWTISELVWGTAFPPGADDIPVWDVATLPSAVAEASPRWSFDVSEDVGGSQIYMLAKGHGITAAKLVDKTTGEVLVDSYRDRAGDARFEDLTLLDGHRYQYTAYAREVSLGDDDESIVDISFGQPVTYAVPEPSSLLLFGTGLVPLLVWSRRKPSARVGAQESNSGKDPCLF